jgi:hypothetical protein
MMFKSQLKDSMRRTRTPPLTADGDSPDRRVLHSLMSFLVAGFDWVRSTRKPAKPMPAEWLERWEDEEYTYLESRIPGDTSELEVDLHVYGGVIFARIRRRLADSPAEAPPPHPDLMGGGGRVASLIEDWSLEPEAGRLYRQGVRLAAGQGGSSAASPPRGLFFSRLPDGRFRRFVHRVLPVGDHLIILQAEDPDRVAAEDIVPDELRSFLLEFQANRELAGVLDIRLAENHKRPEPLIGPALLVQELHRG